MNCVAFEIKHIEQYNSWCKKRNWKEVKLEDFPRYGFIVEDIVAGFLVQTDTPMFCLYEFFMSNPDTRKEDRKYACNLVLQNLDSKAKELGYKIVINCLMNKSMIENGSLAGHNIISESATFLMKELS